MAEESKYNRNYVNIHIPNRCYLFGVLNLIPIPQLCMPPAFDLFVVGSGGGPDETNLSAYVLAMFIYCLFTPSASYLVKPHCTAWADGILAVEAGQWA